jgi:KAP family P-loop domain
MADTAIAEPQSPETPSERVLGIHNRKIAPRRVAGTLKSLPATEHFEVYYDEALGSDGASLAAGVLERAEADYDELYRLFGQVTPPTPFVVNLIPGNEGVSHGGCDVTTITCDAFGAAQPKLASMLIVAQAAEVFMAAQGKGWRCDASHGEALSRAIAADRYPSDSGAIATAYVWLNSSEPTRPNFVASNHDNDDNTIATGCAGLFIGFLRHQLGHELEAIVNAGGANLQETYVNLKHDGNGFDELTKLVTQYYPPGVTYYSMDDTLFPPCRVVAVRSPGLVAAGEAADDGGSLIVTLDRAAPTTLTIQVTSGDPTALEVPHTATVYPGSTEASLSVKAASLPDGAVKVVNVTATYGGSSSVAYVQPIDVAHFRVLLDSPEEKPALGFDGLAKAFAEICASSVPRFAIGMFGGWGSGKTTLMRAIERQLKAERNVFSVWFNAWRYERETDLIVPLLDELRASLAKRAEADADETGRGLLRRIAARLGQASSALVAGARLKAPMGIPLEFDTQAAAEAWQGAGALRPASLYYASFSGIRDAIEDFVGDVNNPARRIVVFVDDLDRCLPESALQVLEGMKLFFDLNGFVFVVGLDQEVIERAIEAKYRRRDHDGVADDQASVPIRGGDYIKKIFQVPYGLPRIATGDLYGYFQCLLARLPPQQRHHMEQVVWPHLQKSTEDVAVNPREVKRLLNAYTLQLKVLRARLGPTGVVPDAVLALQVMAFRADWEPYYQRLTADAELFISTVRDALTPRRRAALPPRLRFSPGLFESTCAGQETPSWTPSI